MKIILINTDPMVAKLIEATAKKTGIMLTSYANTDELDISTLTKDHFVFVDEGALGADKDIIKSIALDCLSCLLYAKTKALKEFSHIVKKPFLPTDILDILQAELLKVGQDLHNASEVTKEEIAQVDDGSKMLDIDMGALDKLGDFDITQEFDAESPLPPLADSIAPNITDTPNTETSALEETPTENADQNLENIDSSALEQSGLEELDNAKNFLEESDMEDLEATDVGELPVQEIGDGVESSDITDSLADIDSSLDELGAQELDSSSEQAQESQAEESLESSNIDIALDTSLEEKSTQELDMENTQDLVENLAQDESLENVQEELDSSDLQAQTNEQVDAIANAVEEIPSVLELSELESNTQDEVSRAEELGEEDLAELDTTLEQGQDEASGDQATEQILDSSETSTQGEESAAAESLEEQVECEVLPQDELAFVKNLLEETAPTDTTKPLESTQELDPALEPDSSAQEFADIGLDDLAQVETESSTQEDKESTSEDYLQLSESEICQALGEELPDVESSADSSDLLDVLEPQDQAHALIESTQEQEDEKEQEIEEIAKTVEDEAVEIEESEIGETQAQESTDSTQSIQEQEIEASQDSIDEGLESKESIQVENTPKKSLGENLEESLEKDLAQDLEDLRESAAKDTEEDLGAELESSDQECQTQEQIPDELEALSELEPTQEVGEQDSAQELESMQEELESKDALNSTIAHDLQELESEPIHNQGALQELGEFGAGLQAINALRDEMQSLDDLDPFASDDRETLSSPTHADDRPNTTQANQTQAQLFSELLANKSAQEIRFLLNGAQISINISFSDKI